MSRNLVLFELLTVTFKQPSYKSRCTKHLSALFSLVGRLLRHEHEINFWVPPCYNQQEFA